MEWRERPSFSYKVGERITIKWVDPTMPAFQGEIVDVKEAPGGGSFTLMVREIEQDDPPAPPSGA